MALKKYYPKPHSWLVCPFNIGAEFVGPKRLAA
jgi:hypothetical protein